jgi:hypothetical protein
MGCSVGTLAKSSGVLLGWSMQRDGISQAEGVVDIGNSTGALGYLGYPEHHVPRSSEKSGFNSPLQCLIQFMFISLHFLICKMRIMMLPCWFCSRFKGRVA